MARPQKCRYICSKPGVTRFLPQGLEGKGSVTIGYDEYEVIRLLDHALMTQQECAKKMQISRPTVTRMYERARRKVADALVNGKQIVINGGDVLVCAAMKPECANEPNCCHRKAENQERQG